MSDTDTRTPLQKTREALGYSREQVTRQPELDPPISSKTLARWEDDPSPLLKKRWRLAQLASIYKVRPTDLISNVREKAA